MTVFAITFRIAEKRTSAGTYETRYQSLVDAVPYVSSGRYWDETTSFFLIESEQATAAEVADLLKDMSSIDLTVDLVVVINLSKRGYKAIGSYDDKDIDTIMAAR